MQRFFAVCLLCLLAWAAWWLYQPVSVLLSEPQEVVSPQMRQIGGSTMSGLLLAGWVEENRVPPSGRLKVWYHISNVGTEPIQDLKLSVHGSGFGPSTFKGCGAPGVPFAGAVALAAIQPGGSCTLAMEIGAKAEAGEYMLTAGFSWTGPQRAPRFEALELGPVRVRSQHRERVAGLLGLVVQLTPIFVPVSLALLGFWFQQRQQNFVHERQAWTAMLPVSHENNSNLYLPLLSAIRSFRKNLPTSEGFFYLLLTIRLMRDVSGKGGFYLKDRKGETLLTDLWSAALKSLREDFDPVEPLQAAVDAVQPGDSFSRFRRKLTRLTTLETTLPDLQESFNSWCGKEGKTSLFLFYRVLHHEMNRIYVFWYGREQILDPEQVRELRRQVGESDLEESLKKRLRAWINRHCSWHEWRPDFRGSRKSKPVSEGGTVAATTAQQSVTKTTQKVAASEPKQEKEKRAAAEQPKSPKPKGKG